MLDVLLLKSMYWLGVHEEVFHTAYLPWSRTLELIQQSCSIEDVCCMVSQPSYSGTP
jgi:hypothetical protein